MCVCFFSLYCSDCFCVEAAIISICMIPVTEKKGHEPTENYQMNLQLCSTLLSFIVNFSSVFICAG